MSAYICDHEHITYLVDAAQRLGGTRFSWYWKGASYELLCGDQERAKDVALMLLRENYRSIFARYPDTKESGDVPGDATPIDDYEYRGEPWEGSVDPVQVLKSIDCLDYQSCEHDGWKDSEAHAFLEALRHAAIYALPGYDAAVWGAPTKDEHGRYPYVPRQG